MSATNQQITLMLIFETGKQPITIKFSKLVYYLTLSLVGLLVLVSIIGTFTYARLLVHSNEREQLVQENEELRRLNSKISTLEQNLQAYRTMLGQIANLAGIDLSQYGMEIAETGSGVESTGLSTDNQDLSGEAQQSSNEPVDEPKGMPVQGFISRTFRPNDDNPKTRHLGLDIAVKKGTRVKATADGEVGFAGWDETFGWKVVLKHRGDVETMYGHNDTLLVSTGQAVRYGQTIALSGNTGVSTAPHVHYEVRVSGQPVNPGD